MYDPFVGRALEPWSFGIYAGGQSILVGTPSGVTLAPEGGAHQSITARTVLATGPGRFDGLAVLPDGRILTASWNDYSLHVIDGERHERIATHLVQPADFGIDTRRDRVWIPLVLYGHIDVWQL